jgi:hypothetical protein
MPPIAAVNASDGAAKTQNSPFIAAVLHGIDRVVEGERGICENRGDYDE